MQKRILALVGNAGSETFSRFWTKYDGGVRPGRLFTRVGLSRNLHIQMPLKSIFRILRTDDAECFWAILSAGGALSALATKLVG